MIFLNPFEKSVLQIFINMLPIFFLLLIFRAKNLNLGKEFKVKKYPTIVALSGKATYYDGPMNADALVTWLDGLEETFGVAQKKKKSKKPTKRR